MKSPAISSFLLLLAANSCQYASAFSPRSMAFRRTIQQQQHHHHHHEGKRRASGLYLWVNDFAKNGPPSSEPSLEAQVQSCLQSATVEATVTTTTSQPLTLFHAADMRQSLEDLQNECTEEGNQTKDQCDVMRMEQRQALLMQLDQMLSRPSLELVQATLDHLDNDNTNNDNNDSSNTNTPTVSPNDWLPHFTQWLTVLEEQTNLCTEEGHQTSWECDVQTMEWRSNLTLRLEEYISQFQTQTVKATQACLQYQLCDTAALRKTYGNLEELELLCTEEGNQTRSFCSIESKEERLKLMEQIGHQLDLAQAVMESDDKETSFQI